MFVKIEFLTIKGDIFIHIICYYQSLWLPQEGSYRQTLEPLQIGRRHRPQQSELAPMTCPLASMLTLPRWWLRPLDAPTLNGHPQLVQSTTDFPLKWGWLVSAISSLLLLRLLTITTIIITTILKIPSWRMIN